MKKILIVLPLCAVLCGCAMFNDSEIRDRLHGAVASAIVKAWQNGGEKLADQQIDKLVAEGRLSAEDASKLKDKMVELGGGIVEYLDGAK